MEYVEAIGTLIVVFVIPALLVCGIVGAPDASRRRANRTVRAPDQLHGPQA